MNKDGLYEHGVGSGFLWPGRWPLRKSHFGNADKIKNVLAFRSTKLRSQRDINLWRTPLAMSLAAIVLFGITLTPDILDKFGVIHIPPWLTMGSIDDARAILSAMMGSVATVLALIFSVALLVISMVATLFGPRLLYRFLQDRVTQNTVGLFMGTFIYICLCFLRRWIVAMAGNWSATFARGTGRGGSGSAPGSSAGKSKWLTQTFQHFQSTCKELKKS